MRTRDLVKACLVIPLLFLATTAYGQEAGEERTWTDKTGQNTLAARFVSFDKESEQVVLLKPGDVSETFVLSDFSRADQRIIRKLAAQAIRAEKQDRKRDAIDEALAGKTNPSSAGAKGNQLRLCGINWHLSPDSASRDAAGSERPVDDRPIAWFRVLGDLDGFM